MPQVPLRYIRKTALDCTRIIALLFSIVEFVEEARSSFDTMQSNNNNNNNNEKPTRVAKQSKAAKKKNVHCRYTAMYRSEGLVITRRNVIKFTDHYPGLLRTLHAGRSISKYICINNLHFLTKRLFASFRDCDFSPSRNNELSIVCRQLFQQQQQQHLHLIGCCDYVNVHKEPFRSWLSSTECTEFEQKLGWLIHEKKKNKNRAYKNA